MKTVNDLIWKELITFGLDSHKIWVESNFGIFEMTMSESFKVQIERLFYEQY